MADKTNEELFDERLKRVKDAVSLTEPDRVPILAPTTNQYPYIRKGHKMAQINYDIDTAMADIKDFLTTFEPDTAFGVGSLFEGQGPMFEAADCKCYLWAGMPSGKCPEDSIQQFIEFPTLEDDEFEEFAKDRTWTMLTKVLPRAYGFLEPMKKVNCGAAFFPKLGYEGICFTAANPEVGEMYATMGKLAGMWGQYYGKTGDPFINEMEAMGFPVMSGMVGMVPFDWYSNFIRGTMNASMDVLEDPEFVHDVLQTVMGVGLGNTKWNPPRKDRFRYIFMHKGMDGFLSADQYEEFYWKYYMPQIQAIIDAGSIPYIFTEGPYNTRFEFLKQLPKGKCVVHFEEVDMATAKKELGDVACIAGNFPYQLLARGTKQEVIDKAKELLDVCAPGGGYLFDLDGGMYDLPEENLVALYETVKEYGKY